MYYAVDIRRALPLSGRSQARAFSLAGCPIGGRAPTSRQFHCSATCAPGQAAGRRSVRHDEALSRFEAEAVADLDALGLTGPWWRRSCCGFC